MFLGDFNFDILLTVPDELGVLFQARWTQTKLPRIFSTPFGSLFQILAKKLSWAEFCIFFGDFNFDILPTVPDVFHFLCFIFCWGVTS